MSKTAKIIVFAGAVVVVAGIIAINATINLMNASGKETQVIGPLNFDVEQVLKMIEALGTAGSMVTDAQIAAIVMEHGAVLHTADADFQRFPGLRWINPITGIGSRGLRKR